MNTLRKLYISLDSVLDLRLGAMNIVSADFAYAVTTKESYYQRDEDIFSSDDEFATTGKPFGGNAKIRLNGFNHPAR